MNPPTSQLVWLRRGLSALAALLATAATSGVTWGLLSALGDQAGAKAFSSLTVVVAAASGACGLALLIGGIWSLIGILESPEA